MLIKRTCFLTCEILTVGILHSAIKKGFRDDR